MEKCLKSNRDKNQIQCSHATGWVYGMKKDQERRLWPRVTDIFLSKGGSNASRENCVIGIRLSILQFQ